MIVDSKNERRYVKVLVLCGAVCVLSLAAIENVLLYHMVSLKVSVPFSILLVLVALTILIMVAFGAICYSAIQLERLRRAAISRHELANHFSVVLAHLSTGNYERALAYARRVTFAAEEGEILDSKIDTGTYEFVSQKLAQLMARGIRVEAEITIRPHELVSLGVNPSTVIGNLLENAAEASMQSSAHGVPRVVLGIHADGDFISVKVWNNGAHIPKNELERVFETGYTTKSDSAGLGLSICKQVIEQVGGSIHVSSSKQHGTLVDVRLPMINSSSSEAEKSE